MQNPFQKTPVIPKKLKVVLYGQSGSGKTLAALSFPHVALVDAEDGANFYFGRPDVSPDFVLRAKTLAELEQAIQFAREDGGKTFQTLVIDSITVFRDVETEAKAKGNGDVGYRDRAKVNLRLKGIYNALTGLNVHIVIIAREAVLYETDGTNLKKAGTKLGADDALAYFADIIVRVNPDHSGVVMKSRGVTIGNNGKLPQVHWKHFEAAAQAYQSGQADNMANREVATQFAVHWRNQGLTDGDMLQALGVSKLSEWQHGRAAADAQVESWMSHQFGWTPENVYPHVAQHFNAPQHFTSWLNKRAEEGTFVLASETSQAEAIDLINAYFADKEAVAQ